MLAFLSIWVIALGGGVWGQSAVWYHQWQYRMFDYLCHQIPARSFWVGGQPMAVCARCFGIYSGVLIGGLVIPWIKDSIKWTSRFAFWSVFGALLINLTDVGMNVLSIGSHAHSVRWSFGLLLGMSGILLLIKKNKN